MHLEVRDQHLTSDIDEPMKIIVPGGTGQIGAILHRSLAAAGHEVVIVTRRPQGPGQIGWDGRTLGQWASVIDGSDVVINLAGRSVSCRYTAANLKQMMDSRVESARVVGEAIAAAARPPRAWLQMSTAGIYAHTLDAAHDEATGVISGSQAGVPAYWSSSVAIAVNWERALADAVVPGTRKIALRTAFVMSPDRGGVFDVLSRLARLGLGGPVAGGRQYVSWLHDADLVRAVSFLIGREDLGGAVNLAAPSPLPQREFMRSLRAACGIPVGLPATRWMASVGAFAMRSDAELLLKSRRVLPGRLVSEGFVFDYPSWPAAAADLARRARARARLRRPAHDAAIAAGRLPAPGGSRRPSAAATATLTAEGGTTMGKKGSQWSTVHSQTWTGSRISSVATAAASGARPGAGRSKTSSRPSSRPITNPAVRPIIMPIISPNVRPAGPARIAPATTP